MRVVWNDGRRGLGYVSVCANWQAHFNWYEVCFHNDQLQQGFEHTNVSASGPRENRED